MRPGKAPGADGITAGLLRKAWPILGEEMVRLFRTCIIEATFPQSWKCANLVVLLKQGKKDATNPKSYRPISLLPTMAKSLDTLIIQDLETETELNSYGQQHGFVPGRSTITAMKSLYDWIHGSNSRHVFGVFLDITGAFDNVGWFPLMSRLDALGASIRTMRLIQSYLVNRSASIVIEGKRYQRIIERGCPQGSQLGPTLWKVAMTEIGNMQLDNTANMVLYADDIALTVAAARPQTAHGRIERYLDGLKAWAKAYELEFSPTKSQLLSLKGGLKPGYSVGFGSGENDARIVAGATAKYLGVILDPKESFWDHVSSLKKKSEAMYRRLRQMTSANWGMGQAAAKVIYEAVFLPRVTYAAEIWADGACTLKKSIADLGSMQREPLRAITSSYKTASTNCLSVVAGVLPLDLEVRRVALKCKLRTGGMTNDEYEMGLSALMEEWQERYDSVDKGDWTKFMIPDVARRCELPLVLDHYTTQFLTGHGDFRSKLYSFKLQPSPNCACGNGAETVRHVLLACTRTQEFREELITVMMEEGVAWPPERGAFLSTRRTYEALRKFSERSLKN
ncbi:unnamed protein product [Macrosiphum euphorbiae]|uniref:Reverse transcriptase domain-containing protein n=1 Tax=Macrosiphum euphorbiae TaxID=13131 RepID=A0AAV0XY08_9HEMI|nr:unnamed protein product [Macrosiphum euphorbiae]